MRILIIEDEKDLANAIAKGLRKQGYAADVAYDGEEALFLVDVNDYDLLILDLNLPRVDGLEVCRKVRLSGASIGILMLTARSGLDDRIKGLDYGADDYLVKPFHFPELLARVRSILRRKGEQRHTILRSGNLVLDPNTLKGYFKEKAVTHSRILDTLDLASGSYCLATVHRQENTDDSRRLANIFSALKDLSDAGQQVILPLHPRTRKVLEQKDIRVDENTGIRVIEAVGYLDMIHLEANAGLICTDSGGVQKEAYFAGVPCITLRDETEWVETVEAGWNSLGRTDVRTILEAYAQATNAPPKSRPNLYGEGKAGREVVLHLLEAV